MKLFAIFCLVSAISCATIREDYDEAVKKIKAEAAIEARELQAIGLDKRELVEDTRKSFLVQSSEAYADVRIESVELKRKVLESSLKAKNQNKSIDKCIDEEKEMIKDLNMAEIVDCKYKGDNLNTAEAKLIEIDNSIIRMAQLVNTCTKHNKGNGDRLVKCGERTIESVKNITEDNVKVIDSSVASNKQIVEACLSSARTIKLALVETADKKFTACVDQILD